MSLKRKAEEISTSEWAEGGWSVGPSDNFGDWTIEVTDKQSREVTPYHVHRKDLACGQNKSEYFSAVFRCEGLKESDEDVSRLELEHKVATVFPMLLTFLYTGKLGCRTKHVAQLFWLADYIMIEPMKRPLKSKLHQFMKRLVTSFRKEEW